MSIFVVTYKDSTMEAPVFSYLTDQPEMALVALTSELADRAMDEDLFEPKIEITDEDDEGKTVSLSLNGSIQVIYTLKEYEVHSFDS